MALRLAQASPCMAAALLWEASLSESQLASRQEAYMGLHCPFAEQLHAVGVYCWI